VLRFAGEPGMMHFINNDEALGKAISPTLHLSKTTPPTLLLYGTADQLKAQGDDFLAKAKELDLKVEMFTAEGKGHGFFNKPPWLEKTTQRMDEFLVEIGYLEPAKATKPEKEGGSK
jgi:acetyl esterase